MQMSSHTFLYLSFCFSMFRERERGGGGMRKTEEAEEGRSEKMVGASQGDQHISK